MLRVVELSIQAESMPALARAVRSSAPRGSTLTIAPGATHAVLWSEERVIPDCRVALDPRTQCRSCPLLPVDAGLREAGEGWRIVLPGSTDQSRVLVTATELNRHGHAIRSVGAADGREALTARQEEAVDTAYSMGYFDQPRRVELREVAGALGVSRSTALELVRRGLSKILSQRNAPVAPGIPLT